MLIFVLSWLGYRFVFSLSLSLSAAPSGTQQGFSCRLLHLSDCVWLKCSELFGMARCGPRGAASPPLQLCTWALLRWAVLSAGCATHWAWDKWIIWTPWLQSLSVHCMRSGSTVHGNLTICSVHTHMQGESLKWTSATLWWLALVILATRVVAYFHLPTSMFWVCNIVN